MYFIHDYNKKLTQIGTSEALANFISSADKVLGQHEVRNYYKFNTYGYPFYLRNKNPKIVKKIESS